MSKEKIFSEENIEKPVPENKIASNDINQLPSSKLKEIGGNVNEDTVSWDSGCRL